MAPILDERAALIESLQGQTAVIPDLRTLFPAWRWDASPCTDQVNEWIDEWLESIPGEAATKRKHRTKGDYAFMVARIFPDATPEKLFLLTKFQYWIFMWDDDMDTGGELASDNQAALGSCEETRTCIESCLGGQSSETVPLHIRPTTAMLYHVLPQLRAGMKPEAFNRLRLDILEYVEGVARQHRLRKDEALPDAKDLVQLRAGDIGAKPTVTQIEYSESFALPEHIYALNATQEILRLSSELVVLVNELVSFEKEARVGQVENATLLLAYQQGYTLQEAVQQIVKMTKKCYEDFNDLVAELKDQASGSDVDKYVECAQTIVTGTTTWSYECGRYFLKARLDSEGQLLSKVEFPEEQLQKEESGRMR